jgi:hypothetical protein
MKTRVIKIGGGWYVPQVFKDGFWLGVDKRGEFWLDEDFQKAYCRFYFLSSAKKALENPSSREKFEVVYET